MVSTRLQSTGTVVGGEGEGYVPRGLRHAPPSDMAPYSGSSPPHQASATPATASTSGTAPYISTTHFLDLPVEMMEKIFSYLGYKNVSHIRLVCKQLDRVCSAILNSTFTKLQTQMLHRFQGIKSKMPRRESARRNHPLACESDIVETLHMRLTLLQMSFGKHIERKHICFFAGEILDEVYRILHYIKVTPKLARPYKVTDELFDLSTMAMEYFKEHIEPTLPEIAYFTTDFLDFTASLHSPSPQEPCLGCPPPPPSTGSPWTRTGSCLGLWDSGLAGNERQPSSNKYMSLDSPPHGKGDESPRALAEEQRMPQQNNMVLRKRIRKIKQGMKRYNYQLSQMRKELRCCRGKIADQQKQILEYATRLDDYDKKTEESNRKFSTMLQELNKCKTELQYWRSKSPLSSVCGGCGQVMGPVPDQADMEALTNQGVLLPELEPSTDSGLFPTPSTSSEEIWNKMDPFQAGAGAVPGGSSQTEHRNKRKTSTTEKPGLDKASGAPPNKKQRTVLKSRTKRL